MQALALVVPRYYSIRDFEKFLSECYGVQLLSERNSSEELYISGARPECWVSINPTGNPDDAIDWYRGSEELDPDFQEALINSTFFTISFTDFSLVKSVVTEILGKLSGCLNQCWVDDDYGHILKGNIFLTNALNIANWDWRKK
jgi:hypothetical protein